MKGAGILHRIKLAEKCSVVGGVMTPPYSNK